MDEAKIRRLMSGEQTGLTANLLRAGLWCASWPYRGAVGVRNRAYNLGIKRTHTVPPRVLSVGNLTTGGTGKTPFTAYLVNWFRERGHRVCLLSRGYRALNVPDDDTLALLNDEALVLARLCPDTPHVQNPDRVAGAQRCHTEFAADVVLLDDGFQHRRLARDLDIVLIDATNPWGYGYVLPRGMLREPRRNLRRADIVVLTRVDQVSEAVLIKLRQEVQNLTGEDTCIEVAYPPNTLLPLGDACGSTPLETIRGKRVTAFCAIGNPQAFRQTLLDAGCILSDYGLRTFADHHHYTPDDMQSVAELTHKQSADLVLTTLKDLVKITPQDWLSDRPLSAVGIGCKITVGEKLLHERLQQLP